MLRRLGTATLLAGLVASSACTEAPAERGLISMAVTYGNGRFVAVRWQWAVPGAPGWIAIETSVDGNTWREVTGLVAHGNGVADVVWTGTRFVVMVADLELSSTGVIAHDSVLSSDDAEIWTPISSPPRSLRAIASSTDQTFVVASDEMVALEGTDWSEPIAGVPLEWSPRIEYLGDRFFVFGEGGGIAETVDGRAWVSANTGLTSIDSMAAIDGATVAFGSYDCCFGEQPEAVQTFRMRLIDGAWDLVEIDAPGPLISVLDVGPRAVAMHWNALSTSVDGGATWESTRALPVPGRGQLATDGNGTVVAAGVEGTPLVSHDFGVTWDR